MSSAAEQRSLLGEIACLVPGWRELGIILLANLILRMSTLFQMAVEIAEPMWAQVAQNMLLGDPPYVTMIGEKPFFLFLYYYVILGLFGPFNLYAVHAFTILWVSCTAVVMYMILRRVGDRKLAISGALIFSIVTTLGEFKIIPSDGETLMNLPMALSALLFLVTLRQRNLLRFFFVGLFIGLAGQFRYQAGIQLCVIGSYLCIFEPLFRAEKGERLRRFLQGVLATAVVSAAFLLVYVLVMFYLWSVGSLKDYVFWTLSYEFRYIKSGMNAINAFAKGAARTSLMILAGFVAWYAAGETVMGYIRRRGYRLRNENSDMIIFSIIWLLWSYVAVTTGARFYSRYFTQLFPALSLLAALSIPPVWMAWQRIPSWRIAWKRWALLVPACSLCVLRFFSPWIHDAIGELDYSPFQKEIAAYIHEQTPLDRKVYIWGWGNTMYFYAKRHAATRFINADFLTGRIPGSPTVYDPDFDTTFNIIPGAWEMFFSDLEREKPYFIVDTSTANIHDYGKYPIEKFPAFKTYLDHYYKKDATIHGVDLYRRKSL